MDSVEFNATETSRLPAESDHYRDGSTLVTEPHRANPSSRGAPSPMQSWDKIDYFNRSIYVHTFLLKFIALGFLWQIIDTPRWCFDLVASIRTEALNDTRRLFRAQHPDHLHVAPQYHYEPLETRHIRLIKLYKGPPGGEDAPIVDLITTCLDSPQPYTALSYTWGDKGATKSILCSGRLLYITSNLYDALRYCRNEDSVSYIWADGICIDQSNTNEKNAQIPLMGDIYWNSQRTQRVTIWLGKEKSTTRAAIKTIRDLHTQLKSDAGNWQSSNTFIRPEDYHADIAVWRATDWYPLEDFLQHPWFLRKWIIQEAVLGINPLMLCGSQTLEWYELARFAYRFLKLPFPRLSMFFLSPKSTLILKQVQWMADISHPYVWERILLNSSFNISAFASYTAGISTNSSAESIERTLREQKHPFQKLWKRYYRDSPSETCGADPTLRLFEFQKKRRLLQLLPNSGYFECKLPHDHLYGLLGMASDVGELSPIFVEYQRRIDELGPQLVDWCLNKSKDWCPWQGNDVKLESGNHSPTLDFLSLIVSSDNDVKHAIDEDDESTSVHSEFGCTSVQNEFTENVGKHQQTSLPSWIPDIATWNTIGKLQVSPLIYSFQFPIHASGWPLAHPKPKICACRKVLKLQGQSVDEISNISTVVDDAIADGPGMWWKRFLHYVGPLLRILLGFGTQAYYSKVLWEVARMTKEFREIALQGEEEFSKEGLKQYYEAMVFESNYQGHSISDRSDEQERKAIEAFEKVMNFYLDFGWMALFFGFPAEALRLVGPDLASKGHNRQFCATKGKSLGWVPRNAKVGDKIVIFHGAKVPYVIRRRKGKAGKNDGYRFIGECYCHGLMQGRDFKPSDDDPVFELK
jgi:hypothetical protein